MMITYSHLVHVLLVGSVGLNVFQGLRLQSLAATNEAIRSTGAVAIGTQVGPLKIRDAGAPTGNVQTLTYEGTSVPTVLYVLEPTCAWCAVNETYVTSLAKLTGERYKFVGLSLAVRGLAEYAEDHSYPFPLYSLAEPAPDYRFRGTPQTFVISPTGEILKQWTGAFRGPVRSEIESFFAVTLPQ